MMDLKWKPWCRKQLKNIRMNERAFRCYGRSTCSSALEKEAAVNAAYEMQLVSGVVQGSGLGPFAFPATLRIFTKRLDVRCTGSLE